MTALTAYQFLYAAIFLTFCFTMGAKRFSQFKQMGVNKNVLQTKKIGVHFVTLCPNEYRGKC